MYAEQAAEQDMTLNEFIAEEMQIEGGVMGLLETQTTHDFERQAKEQLVLQAIAEELGIIPTEKDVEELLVSFGYDADEIPEIADNFGWPFLKQVTMQNLVVDYIGQYVVLV